MRNQAGLYLWALGCNVSSRNEEQHPPRGASPCVALGGWMLEHVGVFSFIDGQIRRKGLQLLFVDVWVENILVCLQRWAFWIYLTENLGPLAEKASGS